jgi:regulatory protein
VTIDPAFLSAMDAAVRLLARRQHAEAELRRKLAKREFDPETVDAVLAECRNRKYVDDAATARFYLEELIRKDYGVNRVRQAMRQKGFEDTLIQTIADEYAGSDAERAAARKALAKKQPALARESDPRKRREKAYRFLAGKGFTGEMIRAAMSDGEGDIDLL